MNFFCRTIQRKLSHVFAEISLSLVKTTELKGTKEIWDFFLQEFDDLFSIECS